MTWLALSLAATLSSVPPSRSAIPPLRLVARPDLHVGVRPAAFVEPAGAGVGLTVQVSVFVP